MLSSGRPAESFQRAEELLIVAVYHIRGRLSSGDGPSSKVSKHSELSRKSAV